MKIRPVYQVVFLIFVVLGIYYPTLFAGINTVDDQKLVNWLLNMESFDFLARLRPGSRFYYRPLLIWTFVADKHLWALEPSFMHLGNMVLHAANAVLVFFIGRRTFHHLLDDPGFLPLAGALLFALHPINTESVNWISGRTDVLATFFVLMSCLFLIRAVESCRPAWCLVAALIFLAGVMSKEVVLFFLPAGCYLLWRWPTNLLTVSIRSQRLKSIGFFIAPFAVGFVFYVTARFVRFGGRDAGVNFILDKYSYDFFNTIRVVFKVLGFYVKKLFVPLPLNFAITSASDHYVWLGLVTLLAIPLLVWRRRIWLDFLVIAVFLMVPGLIIALTNVAWTPLAERYLYLSSAFWVIFVCGFGEYLKRYVTGKPWAIYLPIVAVLLMAGTITYKRNVVWQSNLTLFEDTVRKNPGFPSARNELATALLRAGRSEEARKHWVEAQSDAVASTPHQVHFNHVRALVRDTDFEGARAALHNLQNRRETHSLKFLKEDAKISESMLQIFKEEWQQKLIMEDLFVTYQKIIKKSSDPFVRYRAGQIAMFRGNSELAGRYFSEAYQKAPATAYYREAAGRLSEKLKSKSNE